MYILYILASKSWLKLQSIDSVYDGITKNSCKEFGPLINCIKGTR